MPRNITFSDINLQLMSLWITLVVMSDHEKTRDAASEALIELRKAMGKTQQTFAVEVLGTAIGTIARYETSDPPRGEVLLRLMEIAREHDLLELAIRFDLLYRKEMLKSLASELAWIPATETSPAHGHLAISLPSERAVAAAQYFTTLLAQLDSADPKIERNAVSAFAMLRKAARRFENPAAGEIQDAVPGNKPQKKSKQSTKGTKK
jgi:transcriptional regulator with XRE-family HTH domain